MRMPAVSLWVRPPRALFAALFLTVMCAAARSADDDPPAAKPAPAAAVEPAPAPAPAESVPVITAARPRPSFLRDEATLWDVFLKGGWAMWPILGCATIGLVFFFERAIDLQRKKHAPRGFDKDVIHLVDTRGVDAGLASCLEKQSSLSRVLYAALLRYGTSRHDMEVAVQDESRRLLYDLHRNTRWISMMAVIAPLLGVLGAVTGTIACLDSAAGTLAAPITDVIARGMALALIPAAFGLMVTIPLVGAFLFLRGRADDIVRDISERAIDSIVTLDRKAKRSMQLIEDIEEHLETQEMAAARTPSPELDLELDDGDKAIKSSVTTPAQLPSLNEGSRKGSSHADIRASSSGTIRKEGSSAEHRAEKQHP
jgi:biopolymer transport protein ExbB